MKIGKPDLNPASPASPAIGGKGGEQDEDKQDSTGDTASIRALIKEGREFLKALATSVTNRFRRDPSRARPGPGVNRPKCGQMVESGAGGLRALELQAQEAPQRIPRVEGVAGAQGFDGSGD